MFQSAPTRVLASDGKLVELRRCICDDQCDAQSSGHGSGRETGSKDVSAICPWPTKAHFLKHVRRKIAEPHQFDLTFLKSPLKISKRLHEARS